MKIKFASFSSLAAMLALALLSACGGGGDAAATATTTTTTTPAAATLVSIAVTPADSTVAIGSSKQFVATGTYSDNKTAVIKDGLTWSTGGAFSSVGASTGLVTGKGLGLDSVIASVGAISGSTGLTVRGPWVLGAAGGEHTMARKSNGALFAWGRNLAGQLGDDTTVDKVSPIQVGTELKWTQVAAGEFHTVAIRSDGTLWTWGNNLNGQLGDGTTINRAAPVKIGTGTDWISVAAGKSHTLAVKGSSGKTTLWAWGRNTEYQLGDGTKIDRLVPTQIGAATNWSTVAAGDTHSVARTSLGGLWAWGGNSAGQIGNATIVAVTQPAQIGLETWAAVAAAGGHTVGIRANGTLFTWGLNGNGQLGVGDILGRSAPVQVGEGSDWALISAGSNFTLAVKTDGTLWSWGSNGELDSDGQLGLGTRFDTLWPTKVGTTNNWVAISAGKAHALGVQSDGTMLVWGRNKEGQLGLGDRVSRNVPTMLP